MGGRCELLETCGFFKKYGEVQSTACSAMIEDYCTGTRMDDCKRKEYRRQHGAPPSEDMMPSGRMFRLAV